MNPAKLKILFMATWVILCTGSLKAQYMETIPVDNAVPLAATQTANTWYVDRYAPASFEMFDFSGENVIKHSIDGVNDGSANRGAQSGSFYNTQGRKYDLGVGATKLYADIYIPADFETNHRRAGLWGTVVDLNDNITAYPILSFRNVDGMSPTFSYYSSDLQDWVDLSTSITYDAWYSLEIVLDLADQEFEYYINGALVGSDAASFGNTTHAQNMILQAYNFNDPALDAAQQSSDSYDVYWDNVGSLSTIHNTTADTYHPTIQDAIDAATAGDNIALGDGTYTLSSTVNVDKPLTIDGESEAGVVLDASGMTPITQRVIETDADNITLRDLTIKPITDPDGSANNNIGFTIKAGSNSVPTVNNSLTLENITIDGAAERTPFDIHGIDGVTLTGLTANNTTRGNGINITGCTNVNVSGFTGTNNAWGSIAIYASRFVPSGGRGSDNVTIDGNSLSIDGAVFSQDDLDPVNGDLFNTNISVTGWDYTIVNDDFRSDGPEFTFFADTEADATTTAEGLNTGNGGNTASAIQQISSGEWFVTNANLSIQAAINEAASGDVVNVAAATYQESLTIDKSLTLLGSNATESPNTGSRGAEAILKPQDATGILGVAPDITVVFRGFTVDMEDTGTLGTFDGDNRFMNQTNQANTTWTFEHNIFQNAYFANSGNWRFNGAGNMGLVFNLWDNYFTNSEVSNGIAVWGADPSTIDVRDNVWENNGYTAMNLNNCHGTITNNTFRETRDLSSYDPENEWFVYQSGVLMANPNFDLTITNNSFESVTTGLVFYSNVDGTIDISGNTFDGTLVSSIRASSAQEDPATDLNGVTINNNSFINYVGADPDRREISNGRNDSQVLDATLNYWGSSTPDFSNLLEGLVDVCPYYEDAALTTTAQTVTNTNTGATYCSIQAAIDAANSGEVIEVQAGTYDETVTINKSLTLNGANAGIDCGSRSGESSIAPTTGSGAVVTISASNVTLNGFEITGPGNRYGINVGAVSNTDIKYNKVSDIGTTFSGGNVYGILHIVPNSTTIGDLFINNNCIDGVNNTANTGYSAGGIGVLQSTSTGTLSGLEINDNTVSNVVSNTNEWPTGKIAYGILINVAGNSQFATNAGKVVNANITGNTISDLEGFIATGIGLEGNTENAMVMGNTVTSLTAYKSADRAGGGLDLNGLKFENNAFVGTVTVENNSFDVPTFTHSGTTDLGYAIANYVDETVSGAATATCNWLGTAVATEIADNPSLDGTIFNKTGAVTIYDPWLVTNDITNPDCSGTDCPNTPPTNLTTSNIMDNSADLSWDAVPGAVEYDVWNSATRTIERNLTATSTSLSGLDEGTMYTWGVRARCVGGDYTDWVYSSFTTSGTPCASTPPSGLTTSNIMSTSADLSWDAVPGAVEYEVWNNATRTIERNLTATSTSLSGLDEGTMYTWGVRARCAGGDYTDWVYSSFTTSGTPCASTPPSGLTTSNIMSTSADLSWNAVPGAVEYDVWNNATRTIERNLTATSTSLSGLAEGTMYTWAVRARCAGGDYTDWVYATFTTASSTVAGVEPSGGSTAAAAAQNLVSTSTRPNQASTNTQNELSQKSTLLPRIKVFPNPVASGVAQVNLQIEEGYHMQRIILYNITGKKLQHIEGIAEQQYQLSLTPGLPNGTYIIQIQGEGFLESRQLIINR